MVDSASKEHIEEMIAKTSFETDAQQLDAVKDERAGREESVSLEGDYCILCRPTTEENKKKKKPNVGLSFADDAA